ncbi:MAG TPA: FtsQ-type POTRA domain-containing protein [Firmicutes bacterium]|nr:FtsQ-type POTRA domain-containing protein [Bacillota bacterium]
MKRKNSKKPLRQRERSSVNYRKIAFLLIPIFILVSIILLINYSKTDSYFNVKAIRITGNYYLTPEEVFKETGLQPGININTVKTAEIQKRLIFHPRIRSAKVIKEYPDQILIKIEEVRQIALFRDASGLNEFSENGHVFPARKGVTEFDNPVLSGVSVDSDEFKLLRREMVNFITVLKNKTGLFNFVSEVDFSFKHHIQVNLTSGRVALLRKDEYPFDLRRLEILLKSVNIEDRNIIDLRFSNRAFLRESI